MTRDADERAERVEAARDAIANARLEGREITPETAALVERFVAGEIAIERALKIVQEKGKSGPSPTK